MGDVIELHTCPIEGCGAQIARQLLMCRPHWRMVPRNVARDVLRTWDLFRTTRDREERAAAGQAYVLAKTLSIQAVNAKVMSRITRPPPDLCPGQAPGDDGRPMSNNWTKAELDILKVLWPRHPIEQVMKALPSRTIGAIRERARARGIRRYWRGAKAVEASRG